jgi:hypothetical protein
MLYIINSNIRQYIVIYILYIYYIYIYIYNKSIDISLTPLGAHCILALFFRVSSVVFHTVVRTVVPGAVEERRAP